MSAKRRFKKRYALYVLLVGYILFCRSCMTMRSSPSETAAFFKENKIDYVDRTVEVNERKIHYIQTGKTDAPTLVFMHGSPGSWDAYKSYLIDSILLENYRIIAPDRPGFGTSGFRKSLALQPQAKLLNGLLSKLENGKPTTLIGHSYGGPLIVEMALDDPDLYKNLVILAGSLDPEVEEPENWRKPLTWFPINFLIPGSLKPSNDELWMLKEDLKQLKPRLNELTQRTLIIHGNQDELVPYANVSYMKKEFSNVDSLKVITIENENHFMVWTQGKLITEAILGWASE